MEDYNDLFLPPAARGALFEKTAPLDPPQKLFIALRAQEDFWKKTLKEKEIIFTTIVARACAANAGKL